MSGLDPDEEATITENPNPESESAAVNETGAEGNNETEAEGNNETGAEGNNPGDDIEGEVNRPVTGEQSPQGDQSLPDNDRGENGEGGDGQGHSESAVTQDGDEKTEDEREADVGVIREGQISCGRDEQLGQGLGPEEAEAEASFIGNDSEVTPSETESESTLVHVDKTEQSESGTPDVRDLEDQSEGSMSVINSGNVPVEPVSVQCGTNDSPGSNSIGNSEVVERSAVIPEDEISCQTWMAEDRSHTLSPAESIESCEPECDQETETSPSHGASNEPGESSDTIETGEEEEHDLEETICVVLNPSCENEVSSVSECSSESVLSSQGSVKPTSCSTGSNKLSGSETDISTVSESPVNHIRNEKKISFSESDDDLLSELESELTSGSRTNQNNSHTTSHSEVKVTLPNGMYGSLDNKLLQEIQDLKKQLKHSRVKLEERDSQIKR
jgi:hypothetical protein